MRQGFNVCIFAYGQTGSGKSHSMMGTDRSPGLVRGVGSFLFDFLERAADASGASGFDFVGRVTVSCAEI